MNQETRHIVAVDGGGTGCRVRLADRRGQALVGARGGPANLTSDFAGALANIRATIAAAYRQAGLPPEARAGDVAWLGLAGAATGDNAARLEAALGFARARVSTDCATTVEGALGPRDGLLAMLGTGSFFVRRAGGRDRRIGGWGYQLGDEAGGAWLGRALLARALLAHDGLAPHSPLTRALLDEHDGPDGIVALARGASPGEIARLAPRLAEAAADGDPAAEAILSEAVALICARLDRLDTPGGDGPLCLAGGLADIYAPRLPARFRARLTPPLGDALSGAISLARRHLLPETAR